MTKKNAQYIFPVDLVPDNQSITDFIYQNSDILEQIKKFNTHLVSNETANICHNFEALKANVLEGRKLFGEYPFEYQGNSKIDKSYLSSSLTYNPNAIDKISANEHQATLGSLLLKHGSADFYDLKQSHKNTYNDTYSFIEKTKLANYGEIKSFLESFKRTIIRSRISTVIANQIESTKLHYLWHKDESIFINLRINIPIQTNENYVTEILINDVIEQYYFQEQKAYVYNTELLHRAFCKKLNSEDRVMMIVGISPWFDYDNESKSWFSNEYYGKMHPFEMFKNGLISSQISI